MKTPGQRGPFGRWLKRVREERFDTQAQAIAAMRRLAGVHISASEFAQWESGSRVPRPDNPKVARLYEFFGSQPDDTAVAPPEPQEMAAAIDRQTATLTAALETQTRLVTGLLEELRADRQARERLAARVAELEAYVERHGAEVLADRQWLARELQTEWPSESPAPAGGR